MSGHNRGEPKAGEVDQDVEIIEPEEMPDFAAP